MKFFQSTGLPKVKKWPFFSSGILFVYIWRLSAEKMNPVFSGLFYKWKSKTQKHKIDTIMAKKVNVTPLHDRVIVKAAAAEEKTAGGIIIPDTAKEKPQRGIVVAAGPGKKDEPVTVKTGDTVLYGKYAGTEIQIDGQDYLIMRESDILAIV